MDPHVAINRLVLEQKGVTLADFKHLSGVLLLNVKVEELVFQVLVSLAAIDNSIFTSIDLEQEKHIVLIDLRTIIALDEVVDRLLDPSNFVKLTGRGSVVVVEALPLLNFSINTLLLDQIALKEPIVKFDLSEAL